MNNGRKKMVRATREKRGSLKENIKGKAYKGP